MSVVIETTLGDVTVDLFLNERPRACLNFLKLCKIKYYNYNLFHTISRGFIAQTGDPTGCRTGGESIFGVIEGPDKRYFEGENKPRIKHTKMGLISFVGNEERMIGSQFFITLGEDLTYLDEKHCVFGEVVEGLDVLDVINEVICDTDDRPYQDVRITHTVVLDDPYSDPKHLLVPSRSPSPSAERLQGGRIAPDEEIDETEGKSAQEVAEISADREAKARATILEMIGDIPDAEIAPPENVLFVCKLNPVTTDEDLEIIFNRFGKIKSCEVIRDKKTEDSLQYAFIEFEEKKSCEDAYFKMDNILIDDRRIHVDFSQSVSKVKWLGKGRVAHFDDQGRKIKDGDVNIGKGNYKLKGGQNVQHRYDRRENVGKEKSNLDTGRRMKKSQSPEMKNKEYKVRRRSKSPRDKRKEYSTDSKSRSPRSGYKNYPIRYENHKGRERYMAEYSRNKSFGNNSRDRRAPEWNNYKDQRHSRSRSPLQRSRNISPRRERYKENGNSQKKAGSGSREYTRQKEHDKYRREYSSSKTSDSKSVERKNVKSERRLSAESEDKLERTSRRNKEKKYASTSGESDDNNRKNGSSHAGKTRKYGSSSSDSTSESEEEVRIKKKKKKTVKLRRNSSSDSSISSKKKHKKQKKYRKKDSSSDSETSSDDVVKKKKKKKRCNSTEGEKIRKKCTIKKKKLGSDSD